LSTKDLVFKEQPTQKLMEKFIGLYEIEKVVSKNAVKLKLPNSIKIHPVVNVSRIVLYRPQIKGQQTKPTAPVEIEGEQEWAVEKVLNAKWFRGKKRYLVRWKGFMAEADSWEPEENLGNAKELIEEFHQHYGELNRAIHALGESGFEQRELPNKYSGKNSIRMGGWKVRERIPSKATKKLEKVEIQLK
jgi:hypothetical protein